MAETMKLSVIIPVYNTEAYLPRCLDSLLAAALPDGALELVIVNDGSGDASVRIAEAYAQRFPCIRVISQPNAGLSAARNNGAAAATGDYLWFVDSDDYIAPGALESILDAVSRLRPELLMLGSARDRGGIIKEDRYFSSVPKDQLLPGREVMRRGLLRSVCSPFIVIRREYLLAQALHFMPGILHEDEEFTPRLLYPAGRVGFLPQVCYYAYARPGSITRRSNPRRSSDLLKVAASLDGYAADIPAGDRYLFSRRITDVLNMAFKLTRAYSPEERKAFQEEIYGKRALLAHLTRCRIPKFVLEGALLRIFPAHSVSIYHCLQKSATAFGLGVENI